MIKNELIKFFTPLKVSIYGGIILTFILISDVIFADNYSATVTFHELLNSDMSYLVFVLPIILAPIVSEVFTYDYESGCMKFFLIYKKREKVLFYKIVSLIFISGILIIFTFIVLNIIYIGKNLVPINIVEDIKMSSALLVTLIPILLIYVLISILSKNSTIISLLIFLLVIMSDIIPKTIGDITPRRFFWTCLLKGYQIDALSVVLFLAYITSFTLIILKVFNKKEFIR